MTTIEAILRPYTARRPALQRWSMLPALYGAILPVVRVGFDLVLKAVSDMRSQIPNKSLEELSHILFRGKVSLSAELDQLERVLGEARALALRAVYVMCMSPEAPQSQNGLFADINALLHMKLLQRPLSFWFVAPLGRVVDHLIQLLHVLPTTPTDMNPRVRKYCRDGLVLFAECQTLTALLKRLRGTDWILKLVLRNSVLSGVLRSVGFGTALWREREVVYELARSVLVIPPELMVMIAQERQAQQTVDRLERQLAQLGDAGLERIAAARRELEATKPDHATRIRPNRSGSSRAVSESRRRTSSTRSPSQRTRRQSAIRHRSVSRAKRARRGGTRHLPLRLVEEHRFALQKLLTLATQNASLVQEMAAATASEAIALSVSPQRETADTDPSLHTSLFRRLAQKWGLRKRADFVTNKTSPHTAGAHGDGKRTLKSIRDNTRLTGRSHPAVSLLDFSVQQILAAMLSPFHIAHAEYHNNPEFVALTYHLQTLGILPHFAQCSSDMQTGPTSACDHIKDLHGASRVAKLPGLHTIRNLPVLDRRERERFCRRAGQRIHGIAAGVYYSLVWIVGVEKHLSPTGLGFETRVEVEREIENLRAYARWLEDVWLKQKGGA